MQLFAVSDDPLACAIWLDDKRLNKIITESAQIICTVLADDGVSNLPFKPTHQNHPIVKWAANTDANLNWTALYHSNLVLEWLHRFGKHHASGLPDSILSYVRNTKPPKTFQNSAKNDLRALDFTWVDDTALAYRLYLNARWMNDAGKPKWTKRTEPLWRAEPFLIVEIGMMLVNRTKELIGKDKKGVIPCPCCGNDLKFENARKFECERKECLAWEEVG